MGTCRRAALLLGCYALVGACGDDDGSVAADGREGGVDGGVDGSGGGPTVLLPRRSLDRGELGILVNDQDPQSVEVAGYYAAQRGIPSEHVYHLSFTAGPDLSAGEFATVKAGLDAMVDPEVQGYVITWTQPYSVGGCESVTSAFALGFDLRWCNTAGGCASTASGPLYASETTRPFTELGVRPTMMLAAADAARASELVDRGVAADATLPSGDGYLVRTTDSARSVRWPGFQAVVDAWNHEGGLTFTYVDNSSGTGLDYIQSTPDVLFYFQGLADVPAIDTNTYRPGAVADHLTSYGGQVPTSGQMSVVRWLEVGVTASYGTVVEPCNFPSKFPEVARVVRDYFHGATILEAYWKSVAWPGEGLFVGEPLARPWGGAEITLVDGTLTIRTTALLPGIAYVLEAADSESGPFTVVQQGISVPDDRLATITQGSATAPVYRIREAP